MGLHSVEELVNASFDQTLTGFNNRGLKVKTKENFFAVADVVSSAVKCSVLFSLALLFRYP